MVTGGVWDVGRTPSSLPVGDLNPTHSCDCCSAVRLCWLSARTFVVTNLGTPHPSNNRRVRACRRGCRRGCRGEKNKLFCTIAMHNKNIRPCDSFGRSLVRLILVVYMLILRRTAVLLYIPAERQCADQGRQHLHMDAGHPRREGNELGRPCLRLGDNV